MPAPASGINAALRFHASDAPLLRAIAELGRRSGDDAGVFARAAESAEVGDPLIVRCSTRAELEHIADRIQSYGIARPAIDELTDPRWDNRRR